jgi:hypothetical protein
MINPQLHRQPVGLDAQRHRNTRFKTLTNWGFTSKLNSVFLAATEFSDASREFPIVFIKGGQDANGKAVYAPIAVLGMSADDNLVLDANQGWRSRYVPAVLRSYPFATARLDDERFAVVVDGECGGLNETEGERLFDDAGQPTEFTQNVKRSAHASCAKSSLSSICCATCALMPSSRAAASTRWTVFWRWTKAAWPR